MTGIRYSPHPPEMYSRADTDGRYGIGLEFAGGQFQEWWNLYWLSEPSVDALLLSLDEWIAAKPCHPEMPAATAEALNQKLGGVPLSTLLTLPAHIFAQRLKASPHKHLKPYKLAGDAWVGWVLERAALAQPVEDEQAAAAKIAAPRRTVIREGNVLRVNFAISDMLRRKSEGGTDMYCRGCDRITPCKGVLASQVTHDSSDRAQRQAYDGIEFFQRGRICLECGHKFVSVEVEWAFLEELVELRDALGPIKGNAESYIMESASASSSLAKLSESLGVLRALKIYKGTGN